MAAFATVTLLEDRLQTDLDATDSNRALQLLDAATGLIKREARQHIEQVVDDVIVLPPTGTNTLLLPELPVTAVTSVVVDGLTLSAVNDYTVLFDSGVVRLRQPRWRRWLHDTTVTYTHGYATVPDDLVGLCVEMSARAWVNPRGVASEQIGTYSARYITGKPGLVLLEHEEQLVRSYRPKP